MNRADAASPSIESQLMLLHDYLGRLGATGLMREWDPGDVRVFCDDGFSGMNMNRPALSQLLAECESGRVSCVAVSDLSRLSRNYLDVGRLLERDFPAKGVRFVSRAEGIDLIPDGQSAVLDAVELDLMRGVVSICNNAFSLQISRVVKAGVWTEWRSGNHVRAFAPFGYLFDKRARGNLLPDPVAAPYVQLMFEYAASGVRPPAIAAELRRREIPTPAGYAKMLGARLAEGAGGDGGAGSGAGGQVSQGIKARCYGDKVTPWDSRKVRDVLRREAYAGVLVGGIRRSMGIGAGCQRKLTVPAEQIRIPDAHEPLVSRAVFDAAQLVLAR